MEAVLGADLLTNSSAGGPDLKLPELETIDLKFDDIPSSAPPPKLVPSASDIGPTKSWDGFENLNAESYIPPSSTPTKSSADAIMHEKYKFLGKFERMRKAGIPMRKHFTLESPIDEMRMEFEFLKNERNMDKTIKQFSDWFVSAMSALEWSSKNVNMVKSFGLNLNGLSSAAEMNVSDLEEDFEELYEMYGDKMKMHPLINIPIRTCMMVYMVHMTNQMVQSAPVPNIQEIMRQNPEIARQVAGAAMAQQTQNFRHQPPAPMPMPPAPMPPAPRQVRPPPPAPAPAASNPLAGLMNFMSGTTVQAPPPPTRPAPANPPIRSPQPAPQPAPRREMKGPSGAGIGDILKGIQQEEKKIVAGPPAPAPAPAAPKSALRKSATSEAKKSARNSVIIKL
jgi:hypothetical protein